MLIDVLLTVGGMVAAAVGIYLLRRPAPSGPGPGPAPGADMALELATIRETLDLHGKALRDLVHTSEHQGEALLEFIEANDDEHEDLRLRLKALERCTERV